MKTSNELNLRKPKFYTFDVPAPRILPFLPESPIRPNSLASYSLLSQKPSAKCMNPGSVHCLNYTEHPFIVRCTLQESICCR